MEVTTTSSPALSPDTISVDVSLLAPSLTDLTSGVPLTITVTVGLVELLPLIAFVGTRRTLVASGTVMVAVALILSRN